VWDLILIFLILCIGSFFQGASGFGFGLFSMGLLPSLLTLKDSTLLVLALTVVISLDLAIRFRSYIKLKEILFIVSSALVGRVLSFFILTSFGDMDQMKKLLGFLLIGLVIYLVINEKNNVAPRFKKTYFPILIGFIGGVIGGVFAVGGPFFVFFFLMRSAEKNSYNANLQATFVIINCFTMVLHGINGDITNSFFINFLLGLFAVLIGVHLGLRWFKRLSTQFVKRLASIIVLISALNLIIFP
jgi:uncharacterized protein